MARIILDGVRKVYNGSVVAVEEMNIEIPDGIIVSLLGPSGCGKTTTMRIIAGFESTDKGTVHIEDKDFTYTTPNKRNMSMVFQFPVVYDTLTIFENIAIPLRNAGVEVTEIESKVQNTLDSFGIKKTLWNKKASKLSISDRQRLSLAHAFAVERNLYILDEPFSNIDPKSRIILSRFIRQFQTKHKHTIIFVTHSQSEALTLSDRIAVMRDGKLLQYDTPENIYSKPSNTFVGWFMGNPGMQFIKCKTLGKNGQIILVANGLEIAAVPEKYIEKVKEKQDIIIGIRPENVKIVKNNMDFNLTGTCMHSEPVGSRMLLHVKLNNEHSITVKAAAEEAVIKGVDLAIHFPEENILLFDAATEEAL